MTSVKPTFESSNDQPVRTLSDEQRRVIGPVDLSAIDGTIKGTDETHASLDAPETPRLPSQPQPTSEITQAALATTIEKPGQLKPVEPVKKAWYRSKFAALGAVATVLIGGGITAGALLRPHPVSAASSTPNENNTPEGTSANDAGGDKESNPTSIAAPEITSTTDLDPTTPAAVEYKVGQDLTNEDVMQLIQNLAVAITNDDPSAFEYSGVATDSELAQNTFAKASPDYQRSKSTDPTNTGYYHYKVNQNDILLGEPMMSENGQPIYTVSVYEAAGSDWNFDVSYNPVYVAMRYTITPKEITPKNIIGWGIDDKKQIAPIDYNTWNEGISIK